jgi:outer membrane scaffolding protein for murein synthesis (MipA/OmpV family)
MAFAATGAGALSANRDQYKPLDVSKRFERQTAAGRAAAAPAATRVASSASGAVRRTPRKIDFSNVGRSTFAAPAPRTRMIAPPKIVRTAERPPRAGAFAAAATPSPRVGDPGSRAIYGALPRQTAQRADAATTGSLARGLTQSDSPYGWLVTVNVKGVFSPKYTGSASYGFVGYPTLSFRRPGMPPEWSSPDDSIALALFDNGRFSIGPALAYRGGRSAADAPELAGTHKVKWTLEGGVFANLWLAPEKLRLRGELRRGMRGRDGVNGSIGADYVMQVGQWTLGLGPRAKFANNTFMRYQFGVSPAEAAANPRLAAHDAKAGFYAVGAYGSATYRQNEHWSYTLHGGYDRLVGDAGKSPIVRGSGSRDQWSIGAIVSYTFGVGGAAR